MRMLVLSGGRVVPSKRKSKQMSYIITGMPSNSGSKEVKFVSLPVKEEKKEVDLTEEEKKTFFGWMAR